jgi:glycosyltransferase involved in cell wall biosynthesis
VPSVSIILPTYNRLRVLPRAVASVLAQTEPDFELIVVDDGSSDGTAAWLEGLNEPRLRIITGPGRQGAARARNLGIRAARAELIAFQDSDDEWLPRKLELQLALLRRCGPEVGWVGGGYRAGALTVSSPDLVRGEGYDGELLVGAPFVTPTWLVRREVLLQAGLFDQDMPCLEDWDLIFKLADRCRFRAVEEPVLVRHGSEDSLFGDVPKRRAGLEVILQRHRQRWLREPDRYGRWHAELARLHGLAGDPASSRRWLRQAFALHPWQPRAAALYAASLCGGTVLRRISRSRLAVAV